MKELVAWYATYFVALRDVKLIDSFTCFRCAGRRNDLCTHLKFEIL